MGAALKLFVIGMIFAIPLVLPGISASYTLVIFGIYGAVLDAISTHNVLYLAPFLAGTLVGVVAVAKAMDRLMERFPQPTYMAIAGFMIGSVYVVIRAARESFPAAPGALDYAQIPILAILGFAAIFFMVSFGKRGEKL
jgi:putative membrane protein